MSIKNKKAIIRKSILAERLVLSDNMSLCEKDLFANIRKHIPLRERKIISGYYPIKGEFDILHMLYQLSSTHKISLPVVRENHKPLLFRLWDPKTDNLIRTDHGIEEPSRDAEAVIPQIMIVPCVAISPQGHRLGYGFGFYDRTIRALREDGEDFIAVGVGYNYQVVEDLPHDEKDAQLDWVFTETDVFRCR